MKHKGLMWTIIVVFVALVAMILIKTQAFSVDNSATPGSFISVPTYGYLKCQQGQDIVTWPGETSYQKFSYVRINCQQYGTLLQECDVTFKTPTADQLAKQESALVYSICDNTQSTCDLGGTAAVVIKTRTLYINQNGNIDKTFTVHLKSNQYLVAQYNEADILSVLTNANNAVNKGQYQVSYRPFFIYKYDVFSIANGQKVYNTADCAYNGGLTEANFIIEDVAGGGKLSSSLQKSQILDMNNIRARDAQATYISNFVSIVPQYDLFNDDTQYCYDKRIYNVETVTTPKGTYKVADTASNKVVKTVACCNDGDVPSGYYCDNFELKKLSTSEGQSCSALSPCPIVGYLPIAGKQVASQSCENGVCKTDYKGVECNSAFDCNGGYCVVDSLNPSNNHCANPAPLNYCGNDLCEASRGETVANCPADCTASGTTGPDYLFIFIVGFAVLFIILIFIIIKMNQKKGGRKR